MPVKEQIRDAITGLEDPRISISGVSEIIADYGDPTIGDKLLNLIKKEISIVGECIVMDMCEYAEAMEIVNKSDRELIRFMGEEYHPDKFFDVFGNSGFRFYGSPIGTALMFFKH